MTYDEFLSHNKQALVGQYLVSQLLEDPARVLRPDAQDLHDGELLEELVEQLNRCMPLESMMIDVWDYDVHFEEDLGTDWYFEAAFGSPDSLQGCSQLLAEFLLEKVCELNLDYDQAADDAVFEARVREEAQNFIVEWRRRIVRLATVPFRRD